VVSVSLSERAAVVSVSLLERAAVVPLVSDPEVVVTPSSRLQEYYSRAVAGIVDWDGDGAAD
jgi:hypothetical protein